MDSAVLQSRTADPEEILYNLGFGGSDQLSRIPARFLRHKSVARGIKVRFLSNNHIIGNLLLIDVILSCQDKVCLFNHSKG